MNSKIFSLKDNYIYTPNIFTFNYLLLLISNTPDSSDMHINTNFKSSTLLLLKEKENVNASRKTNKKNRNANLK